jgi:putative membrane protein
MKNFRNISMVLLLALGATAAGACSSDDDDDAASGSAAGSHAVGGHASAEAGASSAGEAPESHPGGAPSSSGGATQGGAAQGGHGGDASDAGSGGAGGASALLSLSDAQILLVLDTVNRGEVEEAFAVLPRLSSPDVKAFAQQMVTDHSSARQSVVTTAEMLDAAPAPSTEQEELEAESEGRLRMLRSTATPELEAAYMELQVAEHAAALELLGELSLTADAPELVALLGTLTAAVQEHSEQAQKVQAGL